MSNKLQSETLEDIHKELKVTNRSLKKFSSVRMSFVRGIASGFGAFLGATIVITITIWFISQLQFVPLIGSFALDIINFIETSTTNSNLNPTKKAPLNNNLVE